MKKLLIIIIIFSISCTPYKYCTIYKVVELHPIPKNTYYYKYAYYTDYGITYGVEYMGNHKQPGDIIKIKWQK